VIRKGVGLLNMESLFEQASGLPQSVFTCSAYLAVN